ncbi:MAG: prepilin-type N-terminal cleavage/methylation domain-containing protein [Desulfobacula sp.]|jgi:type IV pilus assembly protein PilW|nr:prepilin-type N-terminal cleavage/methylation domain-containing protein [Desulfobacula sp.]
MINNNKGFTLVELLVAMAITVIISAAAISSFSGQQEDQLSQQQIVEMQQSMRGGLYITTLEIRMAGYDPYAMYNAGITNAGDGSAGNPLTFSLVADDDGVDNINIDTNGDGNVDSSDGNIDEEGELKIISFQLYDAYGDGDNDIGMAVGGGSNQVIAENIQNFLFTYLDSDGNALVAPTTISAIRAVQIDITAMPDTASIDHTTNNTTRSVSSVVYCRNLNL